MRLVKINSLFVFIFFFSSAIIRGQESIITNEEIVSNSVRDAVVESGFCDGVVSVRLDLARSGLSRPISNGLSEAYRSLDIPVMTNDGSSAAIIDYDILGFNFVYKNGRSRGFLKKPFIMRVLNARVRLTSTRSEDGAVNNQEDLDLVYSDEIRPEWVDLVRSLDIPELGPQVPGSGMIKIVEPVVVTAAVGGLVFLFFANR